MRRSDRVRNVVIRKRRGFELSGAKRVECDVLKMFVRVERLEEERMVKNFFRANEEVIEGKRDLREDGEMKWGSY